MFPEYFLGVKITHIAAGIAGGMVTGIMGGGGWRPAITSVVVGGLTAAYATSPVYFGVVRYFPAMNDPTTEHLSGFIVGLSGLIICEFIRANVKKRLERYAVKDGELPPKTGN
jgi:hypothetical protein